MRGALTLTIAGLFGCGCGSATIGDPPNVAPDGHAAAPDGGAIDAPVTPPPDARACVGGDRRVTDPQSGHCLVFFSTAVTWNQARSACGAAGGDLMVATTAAENALLAPLDVDPVATPDVWMGGTDVAVEGTFVWVTAEAMTYTNWRTGEPNNGGTNGGPENCMVLEADNDGTWDDRACGNTYPFFCEIP
ncbi:MAG: C-type lectin domain-containing protein [Myxococcales bacterium]|nr:C-type lectin domain-containing protein [Myxococcales bacterium]